MSGRRVCAPLYQASYNKYWIDEFYGMAVTRRTMDLARGVFAFDSKVVDGGVNGTAWLTRLTSTDYRADGQVLRRWPGQHDRQFCSHFDVADRARGADRA